MGLYVSKAEYDKNDFKKTNLAANLCILRKVADMMGKTELLYNTQRRAKKGILELSENTISRICTLSYENKLGWDVDAVAKRLKMDKKVFTGELLIKINGDALKQFQNDYMMILKAERMKSQNKSGRKEAIKKLSEILPTEELLWCHILGIGKEEEEYPIVKGFKKLLWADLSKQVREENFEDAQLWKYWYYLKTH